MSLLQQSTCVEGELHSRRQVGGDLQQSSALKKHAVLASATDVARIDLERSIVEKHVRNSVVSQFGVHVLVPSSSLMKMPQSYGTLRIYDLQPVTLSAPTTP